MKSQARLLTAVSIAAAVCAALLPAPELPADILEPIRVRLSVKRILSPEGALPQGRWGSTSEITRTIGRCNEALVRSGAAWTLVLKEIVSVPAASSYYTLATGDMAALEAAAKADRAGYFWRDDAINIYVADRITDAGGACSFPTFGSHREVIIINSRSILGGSEGWLHEMGHYFNLIHTHEGDGVPDTIFDPPTPEPFDCSVHDSNLLSAAASASASVEDTSNALHNIMSYHCDPQVLTPLQIIRMQRALIDFRAQVLEPAPEDNPPMAVIRLPPEAAGGSLALAGGSTSVILDGGASTDGDGGRDLIWRWSLVSGPAGGARFDSPSAGWERGATGIGYGDDDDLTELLDMRGRYLTVYMTRSFDIADPGSVAGLELEVTYDDGFAAYLNGVEVARRNLAAGAGVNTPAASSVSDPIRERFDLGGALVALRAGRNRLSIEVHNSSQSSSDLSLHPILAERIGTARRVLIPSRAVWHYRKGLLGPPPAGWTDPSFDPGASQVEMTFTRAGTYRIRLEVDDGRPPGSIDAAEVELTVLDGDLFRRGDADSSGVVDLSDPVAILEHLFLAGAAPACLEAADAGDDGAIDISDASFLLAHLFLGGRPPPAPYPACGPDPTADALPCTRSPSCEDN